MRKRGIVITPRFYANGRKFLFAEDYNIQQADLKKYLLYWDKIEFPNNNIISIGDSPDIRFLKEIGILSRTEIQFDFDNLCGDCDYGCAYIHAQLAALKIRNEREPGCWSMAQTGNILNLPIEKSQEARTIEVDLYNAFPVPSDAVSLDDILFFKERREAELMAFRSAMDLLYLELISASDIPRAKTAAIDRLENTLKDLHKVANESWMPKLISSLKVELNVPNLLSRAMVGAGLGTIFGVSPSLGAAIGAIAAPLCQYR